MTPHEFRWPRFIRDEPRCLECGLPFRDPIHHAPAWVIRAAEHHLPAKVVVP